MQTLEILPVCHSACQARWHTYFHARHSAAQHPKWHMCRETEHGAPSSVSGEAMICHITFCLFLTLSIWMSGGKAQQFFLCLWNTPLLKVACGYPPWVCTPLLKTVCFHKTPLDFISAFSSTKAELQTPDKQKKGHLRGQELSKSYSVGSGTLSPI